MDKEFCVGDLVELIDSISDHQSPFVTEELKKLAWPRKIVGVYQDTTEILGRTDGTYLQIEGYGDLVRSHRFKIAAKPCEFDHNGECLICDCWPKNCAYIRYLNKDYKYETKEELEKMFKGKQDGNV